MSVAVAAPAVSAVSTAPRPLRVMIVDDAVVVRGLVSRWVEEEGFQVVASLRTGRDAVNQIERANPDVVVLDVEMPELDGISALPLLLEKKRDLVVIMASTVTRRNAEISLRALALGAADYVPKPETNRGVTTSLEFRRELIAKIRHLGGRRRGQALPAARAPAGAPASARPVGAAVERPVAGAPIKLRPFSLVMPRVLLIGSSTGGPQALNAIVSRIGTLVDSVPVLVTQHMPPMFTTILAEHLTRAAERTAREAIDGEAIRAGTIYVAPGGRHMCVAQHSGATVIALDDGPLVNFCRPAVDPLFVSAARVYGGAALAVILTGMGTDGALGAGEIAAAGGSVIAQDETTSVVWGMPGSAAQAGVCSAVLPLDEIAPRLLRIFSGDRT
ncbi:MAG TPA: chemotaxis response regulator protein-glutamate methylesterase [Xanthobacteraceae bacterium]|nr:chemotaxis response regulator protein-glutamate methylesterase [Xanthobacteraceae bacterium]